MNFSISLVTYDLKEAALFLKMSPEGLRQKAHAGVIPAARTGRGWVFVNVDLVTYLRSRYPDTRRLKSVDERRMKNGT